MTRIALALLLAAPTSIALARAYHVAPSGFRQLATVSGST